jgi:hypothetical protein
MKLITSVIGVAALGLVTSALAQDEETATPASTDRPSTTIQETPAPTPTPEAKTATSPTKQPDAQKKEGSATTPAPAKDHAICSGKENERERHVKGQRRPLVSRYRQT